MFLVISVVGNGRKVGLLSLKCLSPADQGLVDFDSKKIGSVNL
jgi:hypothetical protein